MKNYDVIINGIIAFGSSLFSGSFVALIDYIYRKKIFQFIKKEDYNYLVITDVSSNKKVMIFYMSLNVLILMIIKVYLKII
jgi:hypothetical protein